MALNLLADENFDGRVVAGLQRQAPSLDLVRVQDTGLSGADDETILPHAAADDRLLLTHDRRTVPRYAMDRVHGGKPMPGVVVVAASGTMQAVIGALSLLLAGARRDGEWEGQILTIP